MAETWVLNTRIDDTTAKTFSASFISAGNSYSLIEVKYAMNQTWLLYGSKNVYGNGSWTNEAYRTVAFDTTPSGNLLTWLQANGTKQSEPEPEAKKNVCLIDGTSYSILRGKTLISGTGYDIKNGKVLVDGTEYDIPFTPRAYVITVTLSSYTYVIYNDTLYSNNTVLYVTPGDSVRCVVCAPLRDGRTEVAVRVNGTEAEASSFQRPTPYSLPQYSYYYYFTPDSDSTITGMVGGTNNQQHGEIDVTT